MSKLKLMFFIKGSEGGAAGVRAKMFAQKLPSEWEIRFNYRPITKWKGILTFVQSAIAFQPDIIYVMDTVYTGVLAGYIAKKMLGCKLITDTGDVTFELAKSTGMYSPMQLALINWIEQMANNNSDYLVVRGSFHKSLLESQGINNVVFIPDGVDCEVAKPIDATLLRKELGLENNLVVGLVGAMDWSKRYQICYGWDVVEALALLKDVPIKALIIGDGEGRTFLESRTQELGVANRIVFTGQLPYDDLPRYLSAMDVCVSCQSNDLVGMVRTTGKLPLYLAYGKYVIATNVGEASRVLPEVGCLLPYNGVRDDDHPTRLATQLRTLAAQQNLLKVAEQARQVAKENFDYAMLTRRVEKLCRELVGMEHQNSCSLEGEFQKN